MTMTPMMKTATNADDRDNDEDEENGDDEDEDMTRDCDNFSMVASDSCGRFNTACDT